MKRIAIVLAAIIAALAVTPALGFLNLDWDHDANYQGVHWGQQEPPDSNYPDAYGFNICLAPEFYTTTETINGIPTPVYLQVVVSAMEKLDDGSYAADFRIEFLDTDEPYTDGSECDYGLNPSDGYNVVSLLDYEATWDGASTVTYDATTRRITDADIDLNIHQLTGTLSERLSRATRVLEHELGHAAGLTGDWSDADYDKNCDESGCQTPNSGLGIGLPCSVTPTPTMCTPDDHWGDDDIAGIAFIYSDQDGDGCTGLQEYSINEALGGGTRHGAHRIDSNPDDFSDVGGDRSVSILDLSAIAAKFGTYVPPTDPKYDLNHDGSVSILDLSWAAAEFGDTCAMNGW